jgi:hypothetical protein
MRLARPDGPSLRKAHPLSGLRRFDMGGCPKSRKGAQNVEKYCESELTPKPQNGVLQRHIGAD